MSVLIRSALFLAAALQVTSCTALPGALADSNVSFDLSGFGNVRILHANAFETSSETVIRGEAAYPQFQRGGVFTGSITGRIDIPGAAPVPVRDVKLFLEPKPQFAGRRASFTIHTGRRLPPGSTVHLSYRP